MNRRRLCAEDYKDWYEQHLLRDFPVNEIKPLEDMIALNRNGKYDVIVYEEAGTVMGYATIWKRKENFVYLLDYLGVPESLRNRGVGKDILKRIKEDVIALEENPDICLILESETPIEGDGSAENEIRKRRVQFYRRNGWVKMYEMATCGMRFDAMSYESVPENLKQVMLQHKKIYGETRTDVIVPLAKGETAPLPYWMKGKSCEE